MLLDTSRAQGALTGERYIDSLRDGREVWLNGERVDVTTHPAFAGLLGELARLYDLQHTDAYRDVMTFVSPTTGNRVSYSYLLPRTPADLQAKRRNTEVWMEESWGQLGRAPDFCSNIVVGIYDFREDLATNDPRFGRNAVAYHHYCQEHDIALTHMLGDPQIDRTKSPLQDPDLALRIVRETADGIVVRGAKQLATLGPLAQEALVYLSASFALREDPAFVQWFAIPLNAPGIKILCREPFSLHTGTYGHPFASRYDEMDAMVFFDDVLVPWERVFLLRDGPLARRGLGRIMPWAGYSSHLRFYQRIRTFIGVATLIAEAIGIDQQPHIRDKLGELISYAEMVRLAIRGEEADAGPSPGGLWRPGGSPGLGNFCAQISERMVAILREVGTSGLLMQPSEADLANPELRPYLERYMHGKDIGVAEKARLFRLGWDLACDSFGMRQELYERLHRGDLLRNRSNLLAQYDRERIVARIRRLIAAPLPG
jgi:4-hydroxyphenylacetate 3-monooxygenase